jgi:hypothetical protein
LLHEPELLDEFWPAFVTIHAAVGLVTVREKQGGGRGTLSLMVRMPTKISRRGLLGAESTQDE